MRRRFVYLWSVVVAALLCASSLAANASPSEAYLAHPTHIPAGCVTSRDPGNPDNHCYHQLTGLNGLDTPKVNVVILVPVSPAAERDLRIATQAVQMWNGGIHLLARQMKQSWFDKGFGINITTQQVPVDANGVPLHAINLINPKIVVVLSNPVGGLGIGIDPGPTAASLGVGDGSDVPCTQVPNPFAFSSWSSLPGFNQHDDEPGGTYVQKCNGIGGNVCFTIAPAIDPVPGSSDFFPLFELVAHEFGHCLTLGHVGDGADGPWGPTPTNDIMAYSTDPADLYKCVSSLDVESLETTMSKYLDVNGDGKVDAADRILPNDGQFQVQHPADNVYASSTGSVQDCPQPDTGLIPAALQTDWQPAPVATTSPSLTIGSATIKSGTLTVSGTATNTPLAAQPTATSGSIPDAAGDSLPVTDITGITASTTATTIDATMKVGLLSPVDSTNGAIAYSLEVNGHRFDSYQPVGSTDGTVVTLDEGNGTALPDGSSTWDKAANTVTFHLRRDMLKDRTIEAPYTINGETGLHARQNDWMTTADTAPDTGYKGGLKLAAPPLGPETRDAPLATASTLTTVPVGSGTFQPTDTTAGEAQLVSTVDRRKYFSVHPDQQATAEVTLSWSSSLGSDLGLTVAGGSGAQRRTSTGSSITITVPWVRRDLLITVEPSFIYDTTNYAVSVKLTTLTAASDSDHDTVPDIADDCPTAAGPSAGGGCPDTDNDTVFDKFDACPTVPGDGADGCPTADGETVVLYVDGLKTATQSIVTKHAPASWTFSSKVVGAHHQLMVMWLKGTQIVATATKSV